MANNRRPQAPKSRNYVAKNVNKVHRPQTFRDRTKYDRYEDYLQDQLDDYVNNEWEDLDEDEATGKDEFLARLKGEKFDPDCRLDYVEWLDSLSKTRLEEMYKIAAKQIADEIDSRILEELEERIEKKADEEYYEQWPYDSYDNH